MDITRCEMEWKDYCYSLADSTVKRYNYNLNWFMEEFDITLDDIFNIHLESIKSEDPRDRNRLEKMVSLAIAKRIKERGNKPNTALNVAHSVHAFLRANGLKLNYDFVKSPNYSSQGVMVANKKEIKLMLDYSRTHFPYRNRAYILFSKDSGLSCSDIVALDVGDVRRANKHYRNGEEFWEFEPINRIKTGTVGYPHCGPEAVQAINAYLEKREYDGEVLTDNSPLFVTRDGERLYDNSIRSYIWILRKEIPDLNRRLSLHSFRKFNETYLETVMNKNYIAKLQCKSIGDSTAPYSNPQDLPITEKENLTNTYMRCYDSLRVLSDPSKIKRIEEKALSTQKGLKEMELRYSIHKELTNEEIKDLKTRNDILERIVKRYMIKEFGVSDLGELRENDEE